MAQLEERLDPQVRSDVLAQVHAIDRVMGDMEEGHTGDPLVDLWEAQFEAGIEPNLDLTMEDLKAGRTQ